MNASIQAVAYRCDSCEAQSKSAYRIEYYFCHAKYVRVQHRRKEQHLTCCKGCFSRNPYTIVEVNGFKPALLPRFDVHPSNTLCFCCGRDAVQPESVYGLITCTFMNGRLPIKGVPMATVCSVCAEKYDLKIYRSGGVLQEQRDPVPMCGAPL
jgi:hypothetical protein